MDWSGADETRRDDGTPRAGQGRHAGVQVQVQVRRVGLVMGSTRRITSHITGVRLSRVATCKVWRSRRLKSGCLSLLAIYVPKYILDSNSSKVSVCCLQEYKMSRSHHLSLSLTMPLVMAASVQLILLLHLHVVSVQASYYCCRTCT